MSQSLYTYALIKSLYDKGEDYIDSFWPIVIKSAELTTSKSLLDIQTSIQENASLTIPLHILRTILGRAKHKGYLKQNENVYSLSREGQQFLEGFEDEEDVERRIKALINDLRDYYISKNITIDFDEVSNILNSFVGQNLEQLIDYVNPGFDKNLFKTESNVQRDKEEALFNYLIEAQTSKPEEYNTLKEMVFGSIISSVLYVPESTNLNEIKDKKLNDCTIYLDSNIALCILGLTDQERNEAAKELIELLKSLGAKLKIFDFTVYQIRRIVRAYETNYDSLVPTVRVDSLHSAMQIAGWLPSDVQPYLLGLDDKFNSLGIEVEYLENVFIDTEKPYNDQFDKLKEYKTITNSPISDVNHEPSIAGINHDLIVIEQIRKIRKRSVLSVENSKAIFLTSDNKLTWFDFIEMGHKESGTVAEVILDRVLANLVWLKNPNLDLPLKSIIASHSRNLFVKRSVWEKFYHVLKKLEKDQKITEDQISSLFYDNDMQNVLREFNHENLDQVNEAFVLRKIATNEVNIDGKVKAETDKIKSGFLEKLKESEKEKLELAQKMKDNYEIKLESSRTKIILYTRKVVNFLISPLLFVVWILIVFLIYWLVFIKKAFLLNTLLVILTIAGFSILWWWKIFLKVRLYLVNLISKKVSKILIDLII